MEQIVYMDAEKSDRKIQTTIDNMRMQNYFRYVGTVSSCKIEREEA